MGHNMKKILLKIAKPFVFIYNTFKNALFVDKIKCITCGKELNIDTKYGLCEKCLKTLPFNNGHICYKCGDSISGSGSYCLSCKDSQKEYEFARAPFIMKVKLRH